jgi:hypothetical protein
MSFEAYSVAIKLSLTNQVSSGLALLAKDLTGLEKKVVNLQDKFAALKMIGVGWGMSKIGSGMLGFLEKSVDVSKEYTHQVSQMNILGMKQADIANVISASWKTSRDVITTSAADNIEAYRELRAVFGSGHEHEAIAIMPIAQRASAILSSLTGKMNTVKDVGYDIAKAAELSTKGGMTDAQMQKRAEQFMQASIAFGGKVNMQDFHSALKMTRGSSLSYNDDFISHYLPTLIQEMKSGNGGGQQAGTLLRNFDRAVVQQVIPLNKLANWEDAGLIKKGHVVWNAHHTGMKKITPGGVEGQDLASESPYEWWQKFGEPAVQTLMKKNGLTDIQAISALSTNQMTADLFKKFHFQHAQFERDKKMIEEVTAGGGSKQKYDQLLKTDPLLAQQAMHKQWENVQARIGYEILPRLIPYMIKFADGLGKVAQWMQANPEKMKSLVFGLAGLAVSFDAIGKILMAAGFIKLFGIGKSLSALAGGVSEVGAATGGGVASRLFSVGSALKFINSIAVAFMAWQAGTIAGDWINSKLSKETKDTIGEYVTKAVALVGSDDALDAVRKTEGRDSWFMRMMDARGYHEQQQKTAAPVPTSNQKPIEIRNYVMLDGKQVAESVTKHQAKQAARPQTGTSAFDSSMFPPMPGTSSFLISP